MAPSWSHRTCLSLVILASAAIVSNSETIDQLEIVHDNRCELVTFAECADMPYNYTRLPNYFGQQTQTAILEDVSDYMILVNLQCSPDVQFFLCSLFLPVCDSSSTPIPPCRRLCRSVRSGCERTMNMYNVDWPDRFDCSMLPVSGRCLDYKVTDGGVQVGPTVVVPNQKMTVRDENRDDKSNSSHLKPAVIALLVLGLVCYFLLQIG